MAETRRYALGNQLDIEQILLEAQSRWLRPAEICEILRNYRKFCIAPEPPNRPPSGSLFLFDRKVLRYFRKDGHSWRKKKDGKTVKEAHERLKAGSIDVLHCYYAHGEENEMFQRRSYWMLEEEYMHIVLVHYREVKSNKANFGRTRDNEEVVRSSVTSSPASSSYASYNQVHSQTTDTSSLNSALGSEQEDAESDNYQASSRYHSFLESQQPDVRPVTSLTDSGLLSSYYPTNQYGYQGRQQENPGLSFASLGQQQGSRSSNTAGFEMNFEPRTQLDLTSWENVLEGLSSEQFVPSCSSAQPVSVAAITRQDNVMPVQRLRDEFNIKQEIVHRAKSQEKWQVDSNGSSDMLKWPVDQDLHNSSRLESSTKVDEQEPNMNLHNASEPFWTHLAQQDGHLLHNSLPFQLSDAELGSLLKPNLEENVGTCESVSYSSTLKQPLLDNCRTDELKKVDSFTRWMSKELGEVDESHVQSSSVDYWDTVESENAVSDSNLSPQVHLDAYLLSPSLSQDQLFSIIDFSPNWAYADSETKVLVTGKFLKSPSHLAEYKWACMFGEVEVPVEVLAYGVLRCHAPSHTAGRVPFYVTCSNRLACSEVREFEFRVRTQDSNMTDLYSSDTDDVLLYVQLGKLLSIGSLGHQKSLFSGVGEKPNTSCNISSVIKTDEDNDEWFQMVKLIAEEFSPGKVKEQLLQKILKEKLHDWLLRVASENGKGPSILDEEGQGVIHLSAALGYDWAMTPIIAAGVNINFRDVNGWTALHWAAFSGRERTVVVLISLGAFPGALTDPTPEFPSGRTPADLASANGHKGIAGYLAESSLTTHLSSLDLKDMKDGNVPGNLSLKATVLERVPTPLSDGDSPDVSLKDSLTAVCNATQAAARIYQMFRVQSFQKKRLVEHGNDKVGMSDERALSLISVKTQRPGHHDEPVHTAAIRIQNKFRGWKGRKEFLIMRQQVVKIQAHVRGYQVRKHYRKIIWSVGIVEKAILRWRRKGSGLRGFRPDARIEGSSSQSGQPKGDDYDFLKEGRRQTEERLQKALARVKSMVQYPEARDQYRRLLIAELQENKVVHDGAVTISEEAIEYGDDMIDIEELLRDDTFMSTEY